MRAPAPVEGPVDPARVHAEHIASRVQMTGAQVLDVGCGNGQVMRELERLGAAAFGLEIDEAPLAAAVAAGTLRERLKRGLAQALPFADQSFDGLAFVFSFHHVPVDAHERALTEAVRVVRGGGFVVAIDPLPFGLLTEVLQPLEDEFEVRSNAHRRLSRPQVEGLDLDGVAHYEIARVFAGVEGFIARAVTVDPARAAAAADPAVREEVSRRFAAIAKPQAAGYVLTQPCVAFWFGRD